VVSSTSRYTPTLLPSPSKTNPVSFLQPCPSLFLPFCLLLCIIFLPFTVLFLLRNPCLRFWMSRVAPERVGRGPQRICDATAERAGCPVMAVFGTTSARTVSEEEVEEAAGAKSCVVPHPVVLVGGRNMVAGEERVGRRVGR
jgi:hypothetical protein